MCRNPKLYIFTLNYLIKIKIHYEYFNKDLINL